jgi:queuine tRNA-ribosyltransferase
LFASNEFLGKQIATLHNLSFYLWLVREARAHIIAGDFYDWKEVMVEKMGKRL